MNCPHHPQLVNIVTRDTAHMRIDLDMEGGQVMMSTNFNWRGR